MVTIACGKKDLQKNLSENFDVFDEYLTDQDILSACQAQNLSWRERFWTPLRTFRTFLAQVLDANGSCRQAVARTITREVAEGKSASVSSDAGAYSQARQRLPEAVIQSRVHHVGQVLTHQVASEELWCGRCVRTVDGSSCSMPDSPENRTVFGGPTGQKPGCGFPVARLVVIFCWATGAVIDWAAGAYRESEISLWRKLWDNLKARDVVLADRYYCIYGDMVNLMARQVDFVFRLHGARTRTVDFRRGKRLGKNERLIALSKPMKCPQTVAKEDWLSWPAILTVRLIRISTRVPGFRSQTLWLVTSLVDSKAFALSKIRELYRDRWQVELRLRDIKTTMGMDILRGKSPAMVRKEIAMHLLAYNLIRVLMFQAAREHHRLLHRLSFAGTVQRLNAMAPFIAMPMGIELTATLYRWLLKAIAEDRVPYRPNRVEPRALKRRLKEYDLLNKPRAQMRRELML